MPLVCLCSYDVNPEGDSGNPLLDPSTPEGTPSKPQSSGSGDASMDELTENYRYTGCTDNILYGWEEL